METIIFSLQALVLTAVPIALYILSSLGQYTISKRRSLPHPWMSWVPLIRVFQLGTIADHYRLARKGKKGLLRWVLILYGIIPSVCIAAAVVALLMVIAYALTGVLFLGLLFLSEEYVASMDEASAWVGIMTVISLVLYIPYWVLHAVTKFRVYRSLKPSFAGLFLVLSIFLPFLHPMFLFLLRHKDDPAVYQPEPTEMPNELLTDIQTYSDDSTIEVE